MRFGLLAALVALPLALAPGLTLYYDVTPKIIVLVLVAASGLVLCPFPEAWRKIFSSPAGGLLIGAFCFELVSLAISTAWSSHPALSVTGSHWRRFGLVTRVSLLLLLLLLVVEFSRTPRMRELVFRCSAILAIVTTAIALAQYFGLDPLQQDRLSSVGQYNQAILRPPATLGSSPGMANFLLIAALFSAGLARESASRAWRQVGWAGLASGIVGLLLSGTRSAWLGLAAGAVVAWGASDVKMRRRYLTAAAGSLGAALIFAVSPAGLLVRNRIIQAAGDWRGGTRLMLWRDLFRLVQDHPWTGIGLDLFGREFGKIASESLARAFPHVYHESPHNLLLDALVGQGLPGLVFPALILVAVWKGWKETRDGVALSALIASLVTHQFFVLTAVTALYTFTAAALLLRTPMTLAPAAKDKSLLFRCVIAAPLFLFAMQLGFAEYQAARVDDQLRIGAFAQARERFLVLERSQPPGYDAAMWYAKRLLGQGQALKQAESVAGEALQTARRGAASAEEPQNAYYFIALVEAGLGERRASEESLRKAVQWAPNWFLPHWGLSQMLLLDARFEEARVEALRALQLNGGRNPQLEDTLSLIDQRLGRRR